MQLEVRVARARRGDGAAFEELVRGFQDMAVAYGVSLLGDRGLAEDAAQEAFFSAHRELHTLREPAAFAGWLRRIVFKHCDRVRRARGPLGEPVAALEDVASAEPLAVDVAERAELQRRVQGAIARLPDGERVATLLFYMGGRSQAEVADFLEISASAVSSRLHSARGRLRDAMPDLVEETLADARPSRDERFVRRVEEMIRSIKFLLNVADMKRAIDFYCDAVGLEVKNQSPYWSELRHGDSIVALHAGGDGSYRETGLSFTVDDIDAACRAAVDGGGRLRSGPVKRPGEPIKLAQLTDPEGNGFMMSEDVG